MENNFHNNLAYLVKCSGLTQDQFGEIFGLGKSIINQYIKKKSQPKSATIQKIANSYGFKIDTLINSDLKKIHEDKSIIPKLNSEKLEFSEQFILDESLKKKEKDEEILESKNKIIELLDTENKRLRQELEKCQEEKKVLADNRTLSK